jgi:hypothetical protein
MKTFSILLSNLYIQIQSRRRKDRFLRGNSSDPYLFVMPIATAAAASAAIYYTS